jgi:N-glycosylase/DNA lyase
MKDTGTSFSVQMQSKKPLIAAQKVEVRAQVRACLRLDDDMAAFYAEARRLRKFQWVPRMGAGRMLRSPTVFEDVVKMICTTNCSWALTEIMVGNLTSKLGRKFNATTYSFPSPKALAGASEKFLRKEIRCGYRAPYLLELGERIASGKLDMESWRTELRAVKGMGDYAAGNIMKLLGRYDYLGLDSWVRGKFYGLYKNGRRVKDTTIERHYASYGKWQGLFFWLEMTKDSLGEGT